ncbi:carboxypeptidase regulatory-like domain-containing protein [bacterium]|nr:carboxypeptidase regulatory-like domain-containing protein [bacterium]
MLTNQWRPLAALFLTLLALSLCACGGGSSVIQPGPDDGQNPGGNNNGGNPPRTTASLSGQLRQDPLAQVSASPGASMSGAQVSVLAVDSGEVQASTTTAVDGSFRFASLPPGDHMLRLNFTGRLDNDGDGKPDKVELLQKVELEAGQDSVFNSTLKDVDEDDDGESDAYEMRCAIGDGEGNSEERLLRLLHRLLKLLEDRDGDGSLMDENPVADEDGDCMADKPGGGNSGGWNGNTHGGVIRGEISAIDEESLTVNDVTFLITDATRWKSRGHEDGGAPRFDVGDEVRVRGMWNGTEWIALEVKLKDKKHDDDDDDDDPGHGGGNGGQLRFGGEIAEIGEDSLLIGERTVQFDDHTKWFIERHLVDGVDSFSLGDFVFVKAKERDGVILAQKVILISHGDGDGGGGGGDDDPVEENLSGEVEFIDSASISVNGRLVALNAETVLFVDGAPSTAWELVTVGDLVEILALVDGESWTALKVKLLEDRDAPPDTLTVTGEIESLSLSSITVQGQEFIVGTETEILLADGSAGSIELLLLGDTVEVQAVEDGEGWLALRIAVQSDPGGGVEL